LTLRRKFILALVSMVVFMTIISGSISLLSVDKLLDRSASYIQQGIMKQWNGFLLAYYEEHGSWEGIQEDIMHAMQDPQKREWRIPPENIRVMLLDKNFTVVFSPAAPDLGRNINTFQKSDEMKAKLTPVVVQNKTVGYLWFENMFSSRTDFLSGTLSSSIVKAMIIGLIITFLIALLLGIILSRRLTEPLKKLTEAVTSVGQGNLTTRIEPEGSTDIKSLTEAFNEMTTQLAHTEEVRSKMVADIAHELRTPLTVIAGKLESIQEGVLTATPETILPIQDEVIRMTRLVRDLQDLSLAEAGKLPLDIRQVDLEKLIRQILEHFEIALEEKNITTKVTGDSNHPEGDADRLKQVFVNLIDNAIRHSRVGGEFHIRFKYESRNEVQGVCVSLKDSGEGIPEQDIPHVFDRFYRVDQVRDRASGGTGLGLAIAREFIQAHGGQITVESWTGEGTCFTVWLPLHRTVTQS